MYGIKHDIDLRSTVAAHHIYKFSISHTSQSGHFGKLCFDVLNDRSYGFHALAYVSSIISRGRFYSQKFPYHSQAYLQNTDFFPRLCHPCSFSGVVSWHHQPRTTKKGMAVYWHKPQLFVRLPGLSLPLTLILSVALWILFRPVW